MASVSALALIDDVDGEYSPGMGSEVAVASPRLERGVLGKVVRRAGGGTRSGSEENMASRKPGEALSAASEARCCGGGGRDFVSATAMATAAAGTRYGSKPVELVAVDIIRLPCSRCVDWAVADELSCCVDA
jgi:hypothetical protein